jgi:hypothetical protein
MQEAEEVIDIAACFIDTVTRLLAPPSPADY